MVHSVWSGSVACRVWQPALSRSRQGGVLRVLSGRDVPGIHTPCCDTVTPGRGNGKCGEALLFLEVVQPLGRHNGSLLWCYCAMLWGHRSVGQRAASRAVCLFLQLLKSEAVTAHDSWMKRLGLPWRRRRAAWGPPPAVEPPNAYFATPRWCRWVVRTVTTSECSKAQKAQRGLRSESRVHKMGVYRAGTGTTYGWRDCGRWRKVTGWLLRTVNCNTATWAAGVQAMAV